LATTAVFTALFVGTIWDALAGAVLACEAGVTRATVATAPVRSALIRGAVGRAYALSLGTLTIAWADAADTSAAIGSTDRVTTGGAADALA
jgi:hypothetical protein